MWAQLLLGALLLSFSADFSATAAAGGGGGQQPSKRMGKPGTCPNMQQTNGTVCGLFCSTDSSCPGSERCCATRCGQKCALPQEDVRGYCPWMILLPGKGTIRLPNCTSDWSCNRGHPTPSKKCCPYGNRKLCLDAVKEHPGVCPRRMVVQTFVPCNNTCIDDRDCPPTRKCCFTGCSRECLRSGTEEEGFAVLTSRPPPGFCKFLPDRQKCSNYSSTRIYYNSQIGVCEKFIHQGCKGNKNNFATQFECLQTCANRGVCQLPRDHGFGDAYRFRSFYNKTTRTCEEFLYKGSGGNANNFWDQETCLQFCAREAMISSSRESPALGSNPE